MIRQIENGELNWADQEIYNAHGCDIAELRELTGMDENWLQISSWGRRYYINRAEFTDYVHRFSMNYLSSILYISEH